MKCFLRVPQLLCSFPAAQASKGNSQNFAYKTCETTWWRTVYNRRDMHIIDLMLIEETASDERKEDGRWRSRTTTEKRERLLSLVIWCHTKHVQVLVYLHTHALKAKIILLNVSSLLLLDHDGEDTHNIIDSTTAQTDWLTANRFFTPPRCSTTSSSRLSLGPFLVRSPIQSAFGQIRMLAKPLE